jgi:uncharacterized protein with von Willebrand factor type A (vWA) domain
VITPSDYEDLGIDPANSEASRLISSILRSHGGEAEEELDKTRDEGVIKSVNYRAVDVSIMGKILQRKVEELTGKKVRPALVEDMYYLALAQYLNLKDPEEFSGSRIHHDIISNFVDNPDIIKATKVSRRNPVVSRGVAVEFASSFIKELQEMSDRGGEDGEGAQMVLQAILQEGGGGEGEKSDGGKNGKQKGNDGDSQGNAVVKAMVKAGEKANQHAKTIDSIIKLAGTGNDLTDGANQNELEELARASSVKNILDIVNGMPKIDIKKTIKYKVQRPGEKIDVVFGDDITDAHMSDFMLSDDEFFMNWFEGRLKNSLRGNPESFGPIYLLVDKSGSMDEEKIAWAKAVALKLFEEARAEGRDFYMRFFDDDPHGQEVHHLLKVVSYNKKSRVDTVREICTMVSGGGTSINWALSKGVEDIRTGRRGRNEPDPTLIVITDGLDTVDQNRIGKALADEKIELISVMIRGRNESLEALSPKYMEVQKLDSEGALQVVDIGIAAQKKRPKMAT